MSAYEYCGYKRPIKARIYRAGVRCIVLIAVVSISLTRVSHADEAESEALLDEIAAAVDANLALIQCGVAKYGVVETTYDSPQRGSSARLGSKPHEEPPHDGKPHGPYTSETVVYFDFPRVRFDWNGQRRTTTGEVIDTSDRTIFNDEYRIYTSSGASPFARVEPANRGYVGLRAMHPRRQANPGRPHFVDTRWLGIIRRNPNVTLSAARQADRSIRVIVDAPTAKSSHWLSPSHSYGIIRTEYRMPHASDKEEPYQVHEATFRKADNGAFVLNHRVSHEFLDGPNGALTPSFDEEVTLLGIEMREALDPKIFTLDGLELPAGARIIDTVHGRQYAYAVAATDESAITPPEPGRPAAVWNWFTPSFFLVGVALVGILIWRVRCSRTLRREATDD